MEENKDKLKCENKNCSYNKDNYCTILTQSKVLSNRTTCEERIW